MQHVPVDNDNDLERLVCDGNWINDMSKGKGFFKVMVRSEVLPESAVCCRWFVELEQNMPWSIHVKGYRQVRVGQHQ